ncbi:MAG: hypothetical protein AAF679_15645, partial [Pseudomonadota bacterium]
FQAFTFGMDILLFDRRKDFQSKLQETPVSLYQLPWSSRAFMRALLQSNPSALCEFDIFMMYAVALTPTDQTVEPGFLDYIEKDFETLQARAKAIFADERFAEILDPACKSLSL